MFSSNVASYSVAEFPQSGSLSEWSTWKKQSHDTGELKLIGADTPTYVAQL